MRRPTAPSYTAYATAFGGTNEYLSKGTAIGSDSKLGLISFWVKCGDTSDGALMNIFISDSGFIVRRLDTPSHLQIIGKNGAGTGILNIESAAVINVASGWVHCAASWDMAGSSWIYINGASSQTVTTFTNDTIDYTDTTNNVGASVSATSKLLGSLCEFWYAHEYQAATIVTSFRSVGGKPVSLGADGSLPTGTQPLVYLRSPYTSFETNSGSAGNFTPHGSFASDTPP